MAETNRFSDLSWANKIFSSYKIEDTSVAVIGAGGIGSWLTLLLARTGLSIVLIDYDTVELHNLGGQLFSIKNVDEKKVTAIKEIADSFCNGHHVIPKILKIEKDKVYSHSNIISAVDNMLTRKLLFEKWKNDIHLKEKKGIFIDGRLLAEQIQIFCVKSGNTEDVTNYEKYLFDDSEVPDVACTVKQTSHVAAMIASFMTSYFTNYLSLETEHRSVPFKTEIFTPLAMFNTYDS